MKKKFLLFVFSLFTIGATAQSVEIQRDSIVVRSSDRYKVVTNRFFSNWFIGGGLGMQMYFGDHNKQMDFGDRLTSSYGVNVGKWFSPGLGVRVGIHGKKIKGLTQNGSHSTGERYEGKPWEGYWLTNQEFNYFNLHGDVLFNLSNILYGYKADRFYNLIPYAGLGWMVTTDHPEQREVSANLGIHNTFRVSKAIDLTLDFRGSMVNDRFDGEIGERKTEGVLNTLIGLSYKFKNREWVKPEDLYKSESQYEISALRDEMNKLMANNEALRELLASAEKETVTDIQVKDRILVAPILVTFPINKSTVSNEARVNLGYFAGVINQGRKDIIYKVTGYADKGTGNAQINERLSRERSVAIYNVLVGEFGVNPSQLKVSHEGGVDNMFYDDPRVSRAVIVIAE